MNQLLSTSLKSKDILANSVRSLLPDDILPYNWTEKLRRLVDGICLSRSLLLQSIAQTEGGVVKTTENMWSEYLDEKRLDLEQPLRGSLESALKRMSRRQLYIYQGKAVMVIDGTAHAKARSRGQKRAMPAKGKVRVHNLPKDKTILVPGYQEIWVGLLLKDRTILPLTRRLWSENGPDRTSLNMAEECEIRRAVELIWEIFHLETILVADRGYRRKDLLKWLKDVEGQDFIIRLEGKLKVVAGKSRGLLENLAVWWPWRTTTQWRESSKHVMTSDVSARKVSTTLESKERVTFNAVCLTPTRGDKEPMFLATTLPVDTIDELMLVVRLYSWRWSIETFFWNFKQALKGGSWRVFSSWKAIDRLLTAAQIAYVVLMLLMYFVQRGRKAVMRGLARRFKAILRRRFARPVEEMTFGRFLRLIAMDFPDHRLPHEAFP